MKKDFSKYIIDYLIGYAQISKLIYDNNIEEIMINDYNKVFVIKRDYSRYKTNISFTKTDYKEFLRLIKHTLNKKFRKREFIDGILPNSSRINIVSKNIASFNIITIRKFTEKPLNIIDLIKNKTLDCKTAAFLWTIVEGLKVRPANIFICGGTSSGKTCFLNVLLDFIDPDSRIVLVEDTQEVDLSNFKNSVSLVSDISNENSLYDITINTLRMRPDRILIGEVRGKETKGLFTAMDTGHDGCMTTLHANNSKDVITKLLSHPLNISKTNINLLNFIIILKKKIYKNKLKRYVSEIAEVGKIGNLNLNEIFLVKKADLNIKEFNFMGSNYLENLCDLANISKKDIRKIIHFRAFILQDLTNKNITETKKIKTFINKYSDYKKILEISKDKKINTKKK